MAYFTQQLINAITLQVTKEALRRLLARAAEDNIDDLIRLAYGSRDFREGMAAFLEKRAPNWTGTGRSDQAVRPMRPATLLLRGSSSDPERHRSAEGRAGATSWTPAWPGPCGWRPSPGRWPAPRSVRSA